MRSENEPLRFQARTLKCRSYTKYNKEAFNNDLKMVSWIRSDVKSAWNGFKSIFFYICDRHAPLLTKKVHGYQNPWMTSAISNLMKSRDFNLKKVKKSGNQVTAATRNVKSDYNRNLIQENLDDPCSFWKTMKKLFPNKSSQRSAVATSFCSKFTDDKCHLALVSNGFIHKQLAESKVSKATGLGGLPFRLLK
ncbi:hypothetical protein pdam_00013491, partial [Pocillopora damicornis]